MVAAVRNVLNQDKRQTVRQIAGQVNLSPSATHKVLRKDLQCKKLTANWIPHLLNQAQKDRRVRMSRAAIQMLGRRGQVRHIICRDESWFHCWDPASRLQNRQWISTANGEKRPKVILRERTVSKTMLVVFFDRIGMVHRVFVPDGHGIDRHTYLRIIQELREKVRRNRPQQFRAHSWGLLHDGAPAHRADIVVNFLHQRRIPLIPHPGYSPDLSPPDYWLFAHLKNKIRGQRFHDMIQLQNAIDHEIGQIPAAAWAAAMDRYVPRLRRCIQARGEYFERD